MQEVAQNTKQSICDEGSIHPSTYLIRLQGPGCKNQNLQAGAFTNLIIVRRKPTLIQPDPLLKHHCWIIISTFKLPHIIFYASGSQLVRLQ